MLVYQRVSRSFQSAGNQKNDHDLSEPDEVAQMVHAKLFFEAILNDPCQMCHLILQRITGWWFQPIWKVLVNWDDYFQIWENKKCSKPPTRLFYLSIWNEVSDWTSKSQLKHMSLSIEIKQMKYTYSTVDSAHVLGI